MKTPITVAAIGVALMLPVLASPAGAQALPKAYIAQFTSEVFAFRQRNAGVPLMRLVKAGRDVGNKPTVKCSPGTDCVFHMNVELRDYPTVGRTWFTYATGFVTLCLQDGMDQMRVCFNETPDGGKLRNAMLVPDPLSDKWTIIRNF